MKEDNKPTKEKKERNGWKEIKDSKLLIKIPTTEFINEFGERCKKLEWVQPAGEINLGSIVDPKNEHLLGFKWVVPERRKERPFESLFRGMFGGG